MRPTDELDSNATVPSASDPVIDPTIEDDEEEEERPDDALTCPLLDTPIHFDDCKLCHGRGWVVSVDIDAYVGRYEVPCVSCGGEGATEGGGPVTWTCTTCLGTGFMPVSLLSQFDLTKYPFYEENWRDADLRRQNLRGATFKYCDFTDAIFGGADLAGQHQLRSARRLTVDELGESAQHADGIFERIPARHLDDQGCLPRRGWTVVDDIGLAVDAPG